MTVSIESILLGVLSVAVGLFAFLGRELWSAMKNQQRELSAFKEEVPKQYLQRDDFKTFRTEVLDAIGRLETYVREIKMK